MQKRGPYAGCIEPIQINQAHAGLVSKRDGAQHELDGEIPWDVGGREAARRESMEPPIPYKVTECRNLLVLGMFLWPITASKQKRQWRMK